mmetsp:Transcript_137811/g.384258  ORF Transcript_137811/g.384258 Transcript_137811/m.384258 type:complete len:217 (-) Transcript_137811:12-662(-)
MEHVARLRKPLPVRGIGYEHDAINLAVEQLLPMGQAALTLASRSTHWMAWVDQEETGGELRVLDLVVVHVVVWPWLSGRPAPVAGHHVAQCRLPSVVQAQEQDAATLPSPQETQCKALNSRGYSGDDAARQTRQPRRTGHCRRLPSPPLLARSGLHNCGSGHQESAQHSGAQEPGGCAKRLPGRQRHGRQSHPSAETGARFGRSLARGMRGGGSRP